MRLEGVRELYAVICSTPQGDCILTKMIPVRYLQQIRVRRGRTKWMRGTTGGRVLVSLYPISLKLGSFIQAHLEVVGDTTNEEPILG